MVGGRDNMRCSVDLAAIVGKRRNSGRRHRVDFRRFRGLGLTRASAVGQLRSVEVDRFRVVQSFCKGDEGYLICRPRPIVE